MSQILKLFLKRELREKFPSKISYFWQVFNELAGLFFIYYTARAFLPNTQLMKGLEIDYFSFIIVGECFFRPLLSFVFAFIKNMKESQIAGRLEHFQIARLKMWRIWTLESLPALCLEFMKVCCIFVIAISFFQLKIGHLYFAVPLWMMLSVPLFTGLGLLSNRLVAVFRKGESFVYKLIQLAAILAGAYFPVSSLPAGLQKVAAFFPLAPMMDSIRRAQMDENFLSWGLDFLHKGFIFFLTGMLVLILGIYLPKILLRKNANRFFNLS